ncbi:MAG: hypothetical protein ACLSD7_09525 [Coprococcus phoceensis]
MMWLLTAAAGSALVSVNVWKRREENKVQRKELLEALFSCLKALIL